MKALLAALALALAGAAQADSGYYKLSTDVMASAQRNGDELFAELVTPMHTNDNIVNGPRSIAVQIYGSCSERVFTNRGIALFSGRYRGGYIMDTIEADNVIRKVTPGTVVAKLFDRECGK